MTRGRAVTLVLVAHVALDFAVALNLGFYGLAPLIYAVTAAISRRGISICSGRW